MSNNTESFDIVDENNLPLGNTKSRSEVHTSKNYWHRATHIWIVNEKNEILCQQRSMIKDVFPGKWQSFFGGHLKAGQTYKDNAIEELKEELGLNIRENNLQCVHVLKSEPAKHFGQVYILRWDGNTDDLHFDDNEVKSVKWFTIDALKQRMLTGDFCNKLDEKVKETLSSYAATKRD
jgi:isopentenyl-diphosphate delta-isomerase type 1